MKKILFTVSLFTGSLFAGVAGAAHEAALSPGANIILEPLQRTLVRCEKGDEKQERCRFEYSTGYYQIYIGNSAIKSLSTLDEVITTVQRLREAGLCR